MLSLSTQRYLFAYGYQSPQPSLEDYLEISLKILLFSSRTLFSIIFFDIFDQNYTTIKIHHLFQYIPRLNCHNPAGPYNSEKLVM